MRNRQRGVTFIGWVFLLTPLAIVVYAGIRLTPVYLNYMKVVKALEGAASASKGGRGDAASIQVALNRHFEIDMINYPTLKDISVTPNGPGYLIEAAYDDEAPLFANISLHVAFDKVVQTGTGTGSGD